MKYAQNFKLSCVQELQKNRLITVRQMLENIAKC